MPGRSPSRRCSDASNMACIADREWNVTGSAARRIARLDGEGARLYGGRWNSPGQAVVYASSTLALAALEYLIHLDSSEAPHDLMAIRIAIPDDCRLSDVRAADVTGALASTTLPPMPAATAWRSRGWRPGKPPSCGSPAAPVPEEWNVSPESPHANRPDCRHAADQVPSSGRTGSDPAWSNRSRHVLHQRADAAVNAVGGTGRLTAPPISADAVTCGDRELGPDRPDVPRARRWATSISSN